MTITAGYTTAAPPVGHGRHRTSIDEGKVYLAIVLDTWSRRIVGWSIADHIRSELVVDAVQMAVWRRRHSSIDMLSPIDYEQQTTTAHAA
jgi:transposase InsO family protein